MAFMNFEVGKEQGHFLINCHQDLDIAHSDEAIEVIRSCFDELIMSDELQGIVLDLNNVFEWDKSFFRIVAPLAKELATNQKTFHAVQVPRSSIKLMKESGFDDIIPCLNTFKDVIRSKLGKYGKKKTKVDVNFLNPFIEGAIHTLNVQCSMDVVSGPVFLKGNGPKLNVGIAGVLSLVSRDFNGSIAICFPDATFLAVMGNMLGETYETIDKDLEDGAGELLNIIFGHAKAILNNKGYAIKKAIPTIIRGKDLEVKSTTASTTLVLPFESVEGAFHIEIGVD